MQRRFRRSGRPQRRSRFLTSVELPTNFRDGNSSFTLPALPVGWEWEPWKDYVPIATRPRRNSLHRQYLQIHSPNYLENLRQCQRPRSTPVLSVEDEDLLAYFLNDEPEWEEETKVQGFGKIKNIGTDILDIDPLLFGRYSRTASGVRRRKRRSRPTRRRKRKSRNRRRRSLRKWFLFGNELDDLKIQKRNLENKLRKLENNFGMF